MNFVDNFRNVSDIKNLNNGQLNSLVSDLRKEILGTVGNNGGHLASNLGIVETTVGLYRVFDFPKDKLIFDVGHQCYVHKILSGRIDRFSTIRTDGGISGFPNKEESEFDLFTTGHAGTSVAEGLGLCNARDKLNEDYYVVVVVGDGSLVNGLNLEALTSSNVKPKKFIVILNDNGMSISINRNGFYNMLSLSTTKKGYVGSKNAIKKLFGNSFITRFLRWVKNRIKRIFSRGNYFERFGFKYVGIVDGNNLNKVEKILNRVKTVSDGKAVFLHLKTTKGKGNVKAEEHADLYHGVGKNFECEKGGFSKVLGETLNEVIDKDKTVIAVTAGMKDGTGLSAVESAHPDNFIDVGIAEEYAVTLASGMATGGLKPVIAMYSTFLQRAYDQIIHDVCLQKLPVVFCIDRAGLVGADGETHQGVFDLSYLTHIPNLTVLCPSSEGDLRGAILYALSLKTPVAIRYPKSGNVENVKLTPYSEGLWQTLTDGEDYAVLAVGPRMIKLAFELKEKSGLSLKIIAVRSVKPIDGTVLAGITSPVITLEENSVIGGFGSIIKDYFNGKNVKVYSFGVYDKFVKHGSVDRQMKENGLIVDDIINKLNKD